MSFPIGPIDGQVYSNNFGTRYTYDSTRSAWVIVSQIFGVTGLQGPTGLSGDTGLQGVTGPFGGPQGDTGVQGATGVAGGGTGLQGPTGMPGAQGATGIAGAGFTGLQGPQGATGVGGGGGGVGGTGISGYLLKFVDGSLGTVGDSQVFDDGTHVGIGSTDFTSGYNPPYNFKVNGSTWVDGYLDVGDASHDGGINLIGRQVYFYMQDNTHGWDLLVNSVAAEPTIYSTTPATNIKINPTGNLNLCQDQTGNVGIGIRHALQPQYTLDVSGTINSSFGYKYNGSAPIGHVLIGDGTRYVDGTIISSGGSTGVQGNTGIQGGTGLQGPTGIQGPQGGSAGRIFYLEPLVDSDIPGYFAALTSPSDKTENTIILSNSGTGDNLIGAFASDSTGVGVTDLPAGIAFRHVHGNTSGFNDVARYRLDLYKRDGTVETLLRSGYSPVFSGTAITENVWSFADSTGYALLPSSRLIFRLYSARISGLDPLFVTTYFDGSSSTSYIQTTITIGTQGLTGAQGSTGIQGVTGLKSSSAGSLSFSISAPIGACSTGIMGQAVLSNGTTFNSWTVLTDASSSVNFDIQKVSYADYPNMASMHGSTGVFVSSGIKNTGVTNYWSSPTGASGDVIRAVLIGTDGTASKVTLSLGYTLS